LQISSGNISSGSVLGAKNKNEYLVIGLRIITHNTKWKAHN
jgi:hypothetical protein